MSNYIAPTPVPNGGAVVTTPIKAQRSPYGQLAPQNVSYPPRNS